MRTTVCVVAAALLALISACSSQGQVDSGKGHPAAEMAPATEVAPLDSGELIVFERQVPGQEDTDLSIVRPDGSDVNRLRPGSYPRWSPDGSELAFGARMNPPDCTTALTLLERATGEVRWFLSPAAGLFMSCSLWEPSGKRLACGGEDFDHPERNGIFSIRASDAKGLTRITENPGGLDGPLAYSSDGERLLFSRDLGGTKQALFVIPVSGGQARRITPWGFNDDWADWSPDGRTIVFGTNGFLYRVSPRGRALAKIHLQTTDPTSARTAFDVSFSPSGDRIVFSLGNPPGIYTARTDGSDVQPLTSSPTQDHHADWGVAAPRSPSASDTVLRKGRMGVKPRSS